MLVAAAAARQATQLLVARRATALWIVFAGVAVLPVNPRRRRFPRTAAPPAHLLTLLTGGAGRRRSWRSPSSDCCRYLRCSSTARPRAFGARLAAVSRGAGGRWLRRHRGSRRHSRDGRGARDRADSALVVSAQSSPRSVGLFADSLTDACRTFSDDSTCVGCSDSSDTPRTWLQLTPYLRPRRSCTVLQCPSPPETITKKSLGCISQCPSSSTETKSMSIFDNYVVDARIARRYSPGLTGWRRTRPPSFPHLQSK